MTTLDEMQHAQEFPSIAATDIGICVYSKAWRSGTGWFINSLVEKMAQAGRNVIFVCPRGPKEYEPTHFRVVRRCPPRELPVDQPRHRRISTSLMRVLCAMQHLISARAQTKNFLISIPDPLIFSLPAIMLLRLSGAFIVFVVHDPLPHAWKLPRALRWFERWSHLLSYRAASCLVVLAKSAKTILTNEFNIPPGKIEIIPHTPFTLGTLTQIPNTRRILLFGTLRRNKCVLEAIKGVSLARARGLDVRLLLAGEPHGDDPDYWSVCMEEAQRHTDAIELSIGYIPDDTLAELIAECDAFLLPYRDFNSQSGVSILAASNGRPVIATRVGGVAEMFDEGMPGVAIANPLLPETIADALVAFYAKETTLWTSEANAFQAKMLDTHGWEVITRRFVNLFPE